MPESLETERSELFEAVMELDRRGLVSGSSGNASVRLESAGEHERYLVTPAGVLYSELTAGDLVLVDEDLEPVDGDGVPSTESQLHLAIYRARPDVQAVIHTHSLHASVAAVAAKPIPPIVDEMVLYIGGQVEVSDYGFPGSEELAENSVAALGDRQAVLIRNHGMAACGPDIGEALRVAVLVERIAQIYVQAELAGGATALPDDAVEAERAAYLMRYGLDNGIID